MRSRFTQSEGLEIKPCSLRLLKLNYRIFRQPTRFTVLPMPDEIINYLDNLAEQKGAVAEVKVEVGDREINDDGTDSTDTKFLEFVRSIED